MPGKMDYLLIGVGILAAVLVSSYVPVLVKAASPGVSTYKVSSSTMKLENIPGIDVKSLSIARYKGLM